MYHYMNQQKESTFPDDTDLYLLFNKYNSPTADVETTKSSSNTTSPYMSEKEQEPEDPESPKSQASKSRRMSLNKAERRAEHNAIERARRECLNSKFQQLAEVLPNLQNHRRPSKGQIVEKALDWVKQNMTKEDRYQYQIMQLQNENKRLLTQINIVQEQSKSQLATATATATATAAAAAAAATATVTPPPQSPSTSGPYPTPLFPQQQQQQQFPPTFKPPSHETNKTNPYQPQQMNMMYPFHSMEDYTHPQKFMSCPMSYTIANHQNSSNEIPSAEDDNDSHSSFEEMKAFQMSYQQSNFFDMNHPLAPPPPASSWIKSAAETAHPPALYYSQISYTS